MKTTVFLLILITALFSSNLLAQDNTNNSKTFKVHIGDNALMCPNLGPKLKTNIKQIGGEILLFDQEDDIMLVKTVANNKISTVAYITKIVQLTGYPNELITVEEIDKEEEEKLLHKNQK